MLSPTPSTVGRERSSPVRPGYCTVRSLTSSTVWPETAGSHTARSETARARVVAGPAAVLGLAVVTIVTSPLYTPDVSRRGNRITQIVT
jgi:hypothetical protein